MNQPRHRADATDLPAKETLPAFVPVAVVGAGPVGLLASILLGRLGVANAVLEKHLTTSLFPKARKLNTRSMEILRVLGMEGQVRAVSEYVGDIPLMLGGDSLAGPIRYRIDGEPYDLANPLSPTTWAFCPQDLLEPILRARAESLAACAVRFGCEVTDVHPDGDGVTIEVLERVDGSRRSIRAGYVIAADGAHSFVRRALGIDMVGAEEVSDQLNVLFHADLAAVRGPNRSVLFQVRNDDVDCNIGMAGNDRWIMLCSAFPDPTPEACARMIRAAAGVADLDVDVVAVNSWQLAAAVAERFRADRVFLAGDAAHRLYPSGAFGENTGLQDAHNLAWKLAAVLAGWAGEAILDTYEAERRPVAVRNVELSRRFWEPRTGSAPGYVLGYAYETGALVPDGTALPLVQDPVQDYVPTARPGSRAPHYWLSARDPAVSSVDLFDRELVLLCTARGAGWKRGIAEVSATGVPVRAIDPGSYDWADLYGVAPTGAVLVRPDGHVAWRARTTTTPERDQSELRAALARILRLPSLRLPSAKARVNSPRSSAPPD